MYLPLFKVENGIKKYNPEFLNALIECLDNPRLLDELDKTYSIGNCYFKRYYDFFRLLKDNFPLDGNVIEVGCGDFPLFSYLIDYEQQKIGKGTITAYEKRMIGAHLPLGNITFKGNFTPEDDLLKKCNLLVGVYPCEGMNPMFSSAKSHHIDYFIAICDCYKNLYHDILNRAICRLDKESNVVMDESITPVLLKRKK